VDPKGTKLKATVKDLELLWTTYVEGGSKKQEMSVPAPLAGAIMTKSWEKEKE